MRRKNENGQAILLVVVAMGIFLVGALGLAIDGAQLFGHRGMAQVAADAAAQAAILSIFNGTNDPGTIIDNTFAATTGYTHTCSTNDVITPCRFARDNGFGGTNSDVVFIDVPTAAAVGLDPASLSSSDPVSLIRVTITRHVPAGIIRMLGAANTTDVKAVAVAAIVSVQSATPILITHPTKDGALSMNGATSIKICGGPTQSIQVNSSSASAVSAAAIDLSQAGPADPGNCTTVVGGADMGVFGGPATKPGSVSLGTTGHYISPSHIIQDPLAPLVLAKETALRATPPPPAPAPFTVKSTDVPNYGCASTCTVYSPGLSAQINAKNDVIIFKPGLYYIRSGGFTLKNVDGGGGLANNWNAMCTTCAADPDTGTGMVVYDTGPAGSVLGTNPSGGFDISTGVQVTLRGATKTTTNAAGETVPAAPYYGIMFWEDRTANAQTHSLGQGNGCFTLIGTIY
jgi:Putative Flp pilus-assembly TadE/G-like